MICLDCLGDPDDRLRAFDAGEICENLAEVFVIGLAELVLDDDPMVGLVSRAREDVGAERSDPMLDSLDFQFEAERLAE